MNTIKTGFYMMVLAGLLMMAGALTLGEVGIILGLAIAIPLNFFAYWSSDKMALRMAHAHEISADQDPDLWGLVQEQAEKAGLPMPRVYVMENDTPNAFATGRNPQNAAVAVTTGIRRLLTREELGGVLAHEMAHVGNRDTLIMTVVATVAMAIGMIAIVAQFAMFFGGFGGRGRDGGNAYAGIIGLLVVAIVLPLLASVVRMAISRAREFQADATGAHTSGDPEALARALEKLEMGNQMRPMQVNQGVAHLFIVNPLKGGGLSNLMSTHPPMAERIQRLRNMRAGW
jgi:heat shock protein HtpX